MDLWAPSVKQSKNGEIGFIRPEDIRRIDDEPLGLVIDDDVFVHINTFRQGIVPSQLRRGMRIMFFLGPSTSQPGRITAEDVSLYEG